MAQILFYIPQKTHNFDFNFAKFSQHCRGVLLPKPHPRTVPIRFPGKRMTTSFITTTPLGETHVVTKTTLQTMLS